MCGRYREDGVSEIRRERCRPRRGSRQGLHTDGEERVTHLSSPQADTPALGKDFGFYSNVKGDPGRVLRKGVSILI